MNRAWIVSLLAGAAVAALATAPSRAADLPQVAPTYATAPVPVAAYDWTGLYVGINGGYGWGDFAAAPGNHINASGGLVGGTLGYNWQWGHLVAGLETDFDWSGIGGRRGAQAGLPAVRADLNWVGTVRGRIGYAMDRVLFYGTGGLAYGNERVRFAGLGSDDKTPVGWTVGGGVEFAVWQNLTAKIEYRYTDLGRDRFTVPGATMRAGYRGSTILAGINYKFW